MNGCISMNGTVRFNSPEIYQQITFCPPLACRTGSCEGIPRCPSFWLAGREGLPVEIPAACLAFPLGVRELPWHLVPGAVWPTFREEAVIIPLCHQISQDLQTQHLRHVLGPDGRQGHVRERWKVF